MKAQRFGKVFAVLVVLLSFAMGIPVVDAAKDVKELTARAHREYGDQEALKGRWAIILTFDHPVFASNLAKAMKVTVDGKEEGFELRIPGSNERATAALKQFRVVGAKEMEKPATVMLSVDKGLSDATGRLLLVKDFSYQFLTATEIRVTDWSGFYKSRTEKGLKLNVSDYLDREDLEKALKITPEVPNLTITREYSSRFIIRGDFQFDAEYVLKVAPEKVNNGRGILVAREIHFKGPGVKAEIALRGKGSVVELLGRQILPLTLSNVTKIRCTLTKIPPYVIADQIEALRTDSRQKKAAKAFDASAYRKSLDALAKAGGTVAPFLGEFAEDSEAFFAPGTGPEVSGYSLPLRFRKNPEHGGAWLAGLTDLDGQAPADTKKLVQVTDLSVSYKVSSRSLLLWVTSLNTGKPVSGVDVMLVSSNGTRHFVGRTNEKGVVLLKEGEKFPSVERGKEDAGLSQRAVELTKVTAAVASRTTDACAVELNAFRLKAVGITQASGFAEPPEARRGYVFTERGVYRPGETVHFKFYGRAYKNRAIVSPAGETARIEITGPKGDVPYEKGLTLNDFGTAADSVKMERFFPTGTYTIKATFNAGPDKVETVTHTFLVQEYKRPKHFVTLGFAHTERDATDFVLVQKKEEFLIANIAAQYYTGGPVKHAKIRWKATLVPTVSKVAGYDGFFFGNADDDTQFLESGESLLDESGKLSVSIPLDPRLFTGINGVKISATVVDIDGEPATEVGTYEPRPQFFVGISAHPRQVQADFSAPLKIVVIDRDGNKVPEGSIEARIMKKEYIGSYKRDDAGNINYLSEQGWMKQSSSKVNVSKGEAPFDLELSEYGEYLVAFTYEDKGRKYTSQTTVKVGWDDYYRSDREDREERIEKPVMLALSRKEIRAGEKVNVGFHTPRPVKFSLITFEKDEVLDYRLLEVNGSDGSFELTAEDRFQPNVYLSVIAAAAREGYPVYYFQVDTDLPAVYYGFANLVVRSDVQKLQVEIEPGVQELKGRPGESKALSFKVMDPKGAGIVSEMAVCVVDEAVLALTRFKTPELSSLTQFIVPLGVFSGDMRLDLVSQDLYRIFSTKPLTGGDLGFGEIAASLKIRKDFRPVAYFNPSVMTDNSGQARVEFQLPDTTTAYRVYVVACDKGAGFASAERKMVVTKEFFMEPSPPRFLIPGDKVSIPLTLHNKTAEKGKAVLEPESSRDLKLTLPTATLELQPFGSGSLFASAEALGGTDESMMRFRGMFTVPSGKFGDAIEQTIPIHSRYLPVRRSILGDFAGKTHIAVELPAILKDLKPDDLSSSDFKAYLSMSSNLWPKIAPGLKYLLSYPFGCIEQTSSGVIPLAGIKGLVKAGAVPGIKEEEVDKFLKAGVERLLSMQMDSGAFTYWPGEQGESWWGTMYATFALQMAAEAGYEVPEARIQSALKFLREGLFAENQDRYHGYAWTREFAVYCLALGNMIEPSELETFLEKWDTLSNQNKALLLLAAKKADALSDADVKKWMSKINPKLDVSKNAYYDSTYRELAVCLLASLDTGIKVKQADAWAGHLISGMKPDGRWFSTADTGWALLALSRYFRDKDAGRGKSVKVRVHYGAEKPVEFTLGDAAEYVELDVRRLLEKGTIDIEAEPKTLVHYGVSLTYPDLTSDPAKLSQGLILRKTMENLNGKEEIRVGDVVRVKVEVGVERPVDWRTFNGLDYLALEDPVPAGLVPINSELATEGTDNKDKRPSDEGSWEDRYYDLTPTFFEFRDDGVRVFKDRVWSGRYTYSYLARAVMAGDFWMRGSRVSLMYDPDCFGKTLGKRIKVLPLNK